MSDGSNRVTYFNNSLQLQFPDGISITIELPHQPPSIFTANSVSKESIPQSNDYYTSNCIEPQPFMEEANMAEEEENSIQPPSIDPSAGGQTAKAWENNEWEEHKWHLKNK